MCQLLRLGLHLTLRIANLLLQVTHDHLFACECGLRSRCGGCRVLRQAVLCLEGCLPACFVLVLDGRVGLVSCSLRDGNQATADAVPYAVVVVAMVMMSVAPVATSEAEILTGGPQVAEVVFILVV